MPRPPSNGRVTEAYGPREVPPTPTSPLFHYGEDRTGSGNVAPVSGQIVFADFSGAYGNIFGIRETANPDVIWWVAHNANLDGIAAGIWRAEGQYVAPLGGTGNVTGDHSHTERRVGGAAFPGSGTHTNPALYYTTLAGLPGSATEGSVEKRKREVTMIGYNYNESGAGSQTKVLVNPISLECRYPDADEISAFGQSGGVFVNLGRVSWERIIGRCRVITAADTIDGADFTLAELVAAIDNAYSDDREAILDAVAAIQTGDDAAVLAAIGNLPDRVVDEIKSRL